MHNLTCIMRRFFGKLLLRRKSKSAGITVTIKTLKSRLSNVIEPDFGLLDQLLSLEVLSRRQIAKVRHGDKTVYERNEAMLDLLVTKEQCDKFLIALERSGQQHVVNLIMANEGQNISVLLGELFCSCLR